MNGIGERLRPGDPRLIGCYRTLSRLGSGGMGVVFLAADPAGRRVAVKQVHAGLATDPEFRARFRDEVARAQQVPPFCTAEVLDADPDCFPPYLVVEYVDGPDLGAAVAAGGPLSPANVHSLALGVASALTAIHGAGVVHRDLKPRNVLLAPGAPKVIDFGIARALEGIGGHTRTGVVAGTLAYMAPERLDETFGLPVTPAADIFSWGALVTYAATGRTPFRGTSAMVLATQILVGSPHLAGVPHDLRELVGASLVKDPADRPTAKQLVDVLIEGAHGGERGAAHRGRNRGTPIGITGTGRHRRPGPDPAPQRPAVPPDRRFAADRRVRWRSVAAGVLAAVLTAGVVVGGVNAWRRGAAPAGAASGGSPATVPAASRSGTVVADLNGLCLDIRNGSGAARPVQTLGCSGRPDQLWTWSADGTVQALGGCLHVTGSSAASVAACDGSDRQRWRYTTARAIVHRATGRCLDIVDGNTQESADIGVSPCQDTARQRWNAAGG